MFSINRNPSVLLLQCVNIYVHTNSTASETPLLVEHLIGKKKKKILTLLRTNIAFSTCIYTHQTFNQNIFFNAQISINDDKNVYEYLINH